MKVRFLLARFIANLLKNETYFFYLKNINKKVLKTTKKFNFNLSFSSLVSPFTQFHIVFKNQAITEENKIMIKQSYMIFTWLYYLTFLENKKQSKNQIKFAVLPIKKKIFTNTKAPMAHKNWSKEQYQKKIYKISIKFSNYLNEELNLLTLNCAIFLLLTIKKYFPIFETNLLYLKYFVVTFSYLDFFFFNYFYFKSHNKKKYLI